MEMTVSERKEIHTTRLELKPSDTERDLDEYISHLKEEDGFFLQYGMPYSEELEQMISFDPGYVIYYSAFLKDTDTMVGYVGILPVNDGNENSGDLELYIFREFRQNHFGYEAACALIEHFLSGKLTGEEIKEITASTLSDNTACRQLLEKLGFSKVSMGLRMYDDQEGEKVTGICAYEKRYI